MKMGPPLESADIDIDLACRLCGCTQLDACRGGCAWVADPAGEGPLCSACLPMATTKLQLAAMAKLKVTVGDRGELVIDATELLSASNTWLLGPEGFGIERWVLVHDDGGRWLHVGSGQCGPISDILRSIACCYLLAGCGPAVQK